jgi:tetratricopeptide (TPR) repeat protein
MKKYIIISFTLLVGFNCFGQTDSTKLTQTEIIKQYFTEPLKEFGFFSSELRSEIDKGLKLDSTVSFLWRIKSEPLMKRGKYKLGIACLNKAVEYDTLHWLAYRGFMKCIFAHQYESAILDFEECKKRFGNNIEMDHSYNFYIALSNLQLNRFSKAEEIFEDDIKSLEKEKGYDWVHHLDLYYLAITKYEQKKYKDAIEVFDSALTKYPNFSEAQFYKSKCLERLGQPILAKTLRTTAEINGKNGYTINEDNIIHVRYPYQIMWIYR